MARPRRMRRIHFNPRVDYFKPRGIALKDLEIINLELEELEALRLRYILDLEQKEAAKKMDISTSTYQRILSLAHKKITQALVEGRAVQIIKRDFQYKIND